MGFKLAAQRWQVCGPALPVFVFFSLYLRGYVCSREQRDNKRQSNQLGFLGLCFAFYILIRYNHNSPLPKTHKEATLMKSGVQPCQPTEETARASTSFFSNISTSQILNRKIWCWKCSSLLSHLPQRWWNGCFDSNVNLWPILSCNDLTVVTFIGTCPVAPQVESWGCTGISRQTPLQGMGQI